MDIIGTWRVGEFTDPDGKRIDPKDGEDVMMLFMNVAFCEEGEVLITMPLDREFSKEELEIFDEETYADLEEQGLYDRRFPDRLIIERADWEASGEGARVTPEDEESILATPGSEFTEVKVEDGCIMLYNDVKLVRV